MKVVQVIVLLAMVVAAAHGEDVINGAPSEAPSAAPTMSPSGAPSGAPSKSPTSSPSISPSSTPSESPSGSPTLSPSLSPSKSPSSSPSASPSASPTVSPSESPSMSPSTSPTTSPSASPSSSPTASPSALPSASPSASPSTSPTLSPSTTPTVSPSASPSTSPTLSPSQSPTTSPTLSPSQSPTTSPTLSPSISPTLSPSLSPSTSPTQSPSLSPTQSPTTVLHYWAKLNHFCSMQKKADICNSKVYQNDTPFGFQGEKICKWNGRGGSGARCKIKADLPAGYPTSAPTTSLDKWLEDKEICEAIKQGSLCKLTPFCRFDKRRKKCMVSRRSPPTLAPTGAPTEPLTPSEQYQYYLGVCKSARNNKACRQQRDSGIPICNWLGGKRGNCHPKMADPDATFAPTSAPTTGKDLYDYHVELCSAKHGHGGKKCARIRIGGNQICHYFKASQKCQPKMPNPQPPTRSPSIAPTNFVPTSPTMPSPTSAPTTTYDHHKANCGAFHGRRQECRVKTLDSSRICKYETKSKKCVPKLNPRLG